MQSQNSRKPIGYWLKSAHDALDHSLDGALGDQGLTRTHWQMLNLLHETDAPATKTQLFETMQTFVDEAGLDRILEMFLAKGWLNELGASYSLTDAGQEAHGQLFKIIGEKRQQAMVGITQEEYALVLDVLQRIVANLNE